MIVKYDYIHPSEYKESFFHPEHPCSLHVNNAIFKNWKITDVRKRSFSKVIEYKSSCNGNSFISYNTLFPNKYPKN